MTAGKAIANTILRQLGGMRFAAMTGANTFLHGQDALTFSIPRAKQGINRVKVILTPMDVYTVEFWKVNARKAEAVKVAESTNIYADALSACFTRETGLYTRL